MSLARLSDAAENKMWRLFDSLQIVAKEIVCYGDRPTDAQGTSPDAVSTTFSPSPIPVWSVKTG